MEQFKITKDFSTILEGWNGPLPKGACYGKVNNVTYITYRKEGKTSFFVRRIGEDKFHGDKAGKYPTIQAIIPTLPEAEFCAFRAKKKQDLFHAKKREESRVIREKLQELRDIRECGPQERRPGEYIYRMRPEAAYSYDKNGIPCKDWEEKDILFLSREEKRVHTTPNGIVYNGVPVFKEAQKKGEYLNKPFEGTRTLPESGRPMGKPQECTKKETLRVLDKTHGKTEGKPKFNVAMPTSSPKREEKDKVYLEKNSREEAIKMYGGKW